MDTSTLINLIAAILVGGGTFALAFMTWKSIQQTRSIRDSEKKEGLLNEIVDWAIDVTKGELLMEFADVRDIKDIQRRRLYLYVTVDKLQFSFRQARTRGLYISRIVSILGADLQQVVGELVRNLEAHIQALEECMDTINGPACERTLSGAITAAGKTTDSKKLLDESAARVLEEAVKIKTEDIGKGEANMPRKAEATGSGEMTLKDIKNHLTRQDKEIKKQSYLAGYFFGGAIVLIGITLWLQMLSQKWCVDIGFLIVTGGVFMGWCYYQQKKLK